MSPVTGARRRAGRDDAGAGAAGARARILDAAVRLVSERGAAATSMRQLAAACDLNVATIYHYFPSKEHLLRAVIAERGYLERLATEALPAAAIDPTWPATRRLATLLAVVWAGCGEEEVVWRLLIGESLRGEPAAREMSNALVEGIDAALAGWLAEAVPEIAGDDEAAGRAARLCRALIFSMLVEHLALGPDDTRANARITEFAEVVAGR